MCTGGGEGGASNKGESGWGDEQSRQGWGDEQSGQGWGDEQSGQGWGEEAPSHGGAGRGTTTGQASSCLLPLPLLRNSACLCGPHQHMVAFSAAAAGSTLFE